MPLPERIDFQLEVGKPVRVVKRDAVRIDQERSIEINMMRHLMDRYQAQAVDHARKLSRFSLTMG